jgi:hypothetical protein
MANLLYSLGALVLFVLFIVEPLCRQLLTPLGRRSLSRRLNPPSALARALGYLLWLATAALPPLIAAHYYIAYSNSVVADTRDERTYVWKKAPCVIHSSTFRSNDAARGGAERALDDDRGTVARRRRLKGGHAGGVNNKNKPFVYTASYSVTLLGVSAGGGAGRNLQVGAACSDFDTTAADPDQRCKLTTIGDDGGEQDFTADCDAPVSASCKTSTPWYDFWSHSGSKDSLPTSLRQLAAELSKPSPYTCGCETCANFTATCHEHATRPRAAWLDPFKTGHPPSCCAADGPSPGAPCKCATSDKPCHLPYTWGGKSYESCSIDQGGPSSRSAWCGTKAAVSGSIFGTDSCKCDLATCQMGGLAGHGGNQSLGGVGVRAGAAPAECFYLSNWENVSHGHRTPWPEMPVELERIDDALGDRGTLSSYDDWLIVSIVLYAFAVYPALRMHCEGRAPAAAARMLAQAHKVEAAEATERARAQLVRAEEAARGAATGARLFAGPPEAKEDAAKENTGNAPIYKQEEAWLKEVYTGGNRVVTAWESTAVADAVAAHEAGGGLTATLLPSDAGVQ